MAFITIFIHWHIKMVIANIWTYSPSLTFQHFTEIQLELCIIIMIMMMYSTKTKTRMIIGGIQRCSKLKLSGLEVAMEAYQEHSYREYNVSLGRICYYYKHLLTVECDITVTTTIMTPPKLAVFEISFLWCPVDSCNGNARRLHFHLHPIKPMCKSVLPNWLPILPTHITPPSPCAPACLVVGEWT